jgi:hypothetical protein
MSLATVAVAQEQKGEQRQSITSARDSMPAAEAAANRFQGTVAIWFSSHYQIDSRDWDNIREFKGPFHPLLRYYKSDDPEVLKTQLRWMRRAGVDAIVYDVFSTGKWSLKNLPNDKTLSLLLDELAHQEKESRKLKLIIWLEKYLGDPTVEEYRYALQYIRTNFADRDFYYRYKDKPLVVTYLNGEAGAILDIERENHFFALRRIRPYSTSEWSYINECPQPLNRQWMPVSPGIDPSMENAYIAKRKGPLVFKAREDSFFEKQLLRVRAANPEIMFISGWNDWQYGCQIEPAKEYGFKCVDTAARLLGREAETAPYRVLGER